MLKLEAIESAYGQSRILFGIDLDVAAGEVVTLLGRNGMGKTTTIKSIFGLLKPLGGRVVIDGEEPFAEDEWPTVRIGGVDFRTAETCDRCVMATFDPETLAGGKEPIRTLARHRRWDGKTWFGTRLVPLGSGDISLGDEVVPGT